MSSPTLVLIVMASMLVLLFELVLANQGPVTVALLEVAMRPLLEEDLYDAHVAHLVLLEEVDLQVAAAAAVELHVAPVAQLVLLEDV